MSRPDYDKVGLLAIKDGKILLCRKKHGTQLLILPGGCREPGEASLETLLREVQEELGTSKVSGLEYVGTYRHQAAGAGGKTVQIELYRGELGEEVTAHAEIKELVWYSGDDPDSLSLSIREKILPDLIARRLIPWEFT